jgi:hypothetical protein
MELNFCFSCLVISIGWFQDDPILLEHDER